MSFPNNLILEVQVGGSDTANAGIFNPLNASMATDLAVVSGGTTSSPVVSSASYTFIARDVGHWLFVKAGTNFAAGWYLIASVSGGQATLSAGVGSVPLLDVAGGNAPAKMNTAAGITTTSTATGGTWTIDYSQSTVVSFTGMTLVSSTTFTISDATVGKNFVGNYVVITGGTGFNAVRFEVSSVSGTTGTGSNFSTGTTIGTSGSTGGTGGIGGPLATLGTIGTWLQSQHNAFVKYSATAYSVTTSTPGAGGPLKISGAGNTFPPRIIGYDTNRTIVNRDANRPTIRAAVTASYNMVQCDVNNNGDFTNLIIDGNSRTGVFGMRGSNVGYSYMYARRVDVINCPAGGMIADVICDCLATNSGYGIAARVRATDCVSYSNSGNGFGLNGTESGPGFYLRCLSYSNGGIGFAMNVGASAEHCTAYGNTGDGFGYIFDYVGGFSVKNCVSVSNGGYGFSSTGGTFTGGYPHCLVNCATYGNTSGSTTGGISGFNAPYGYIENLIILGSSPFQSPGTGDFNLKTADLDTPGTGAYQLKAASYPATLWRTSASNYLDLGAKQHADRGGGGGGGGGLAGSASNRNGGKQ